MSVSLDRYAVFFEVARLGSITLAAEKLYISQPAVSRNVRLLEQTLGCRLFARTPKGVALTREGETLFRYVSSAMEQFRLGERKLAEQLNLDSGEICVGASDMTLQFFLLPYLERFHAAYPGVKIRVTNGPTPETLRFLTQGVIDFGVVSGPLDEGAARHAAPVGEVQDVFIAGQRFASLAREPLPLDRLETLPLIFLEQNTSTRRALDEFLARSGTPLAPEFELATSSLIVQFVQRNLGVGCVVRDFALEAIASGSVVELTVTPSPPARQLWVVRGDTPPSRAAERLLDMVFT